MCSATVVLSGLPGTGPVGYNLSGHKYYEKAFLQFSPKHIKWSQFGHSSKRIFSKKLSASGGGFAPLTPHQGLCPLDPRWGLRPQTPVIGSRSRARHGNPNKSTNPAYTPVIYTARPRFRG